MNLQQFFDELFGEKPDDTYICIFTLPGEAAAFFQKPDEAIRHIDTIRDRGVHIYFGTNFLKHKPPRGRGKSADTAGVSCFYMDVDMDVAANNAHMKTDLPGTINEAVDLVKGNGFDPSVIVHSGYGLHVYWIFKEPWVYADNADREKYHTLLLRLQATIKAKAQKSGWQLDSTGDLARILRVPSTFNVKIPTSPAEVKIIEESNIRYDPEGLDQFLVSESEIKKTVVPEHLKVQIEKNLVLDPFAEPPVEKFDQLLEIEENFAMSWKAKRPEFGDDPSRYAQSLADYAAKARWTEQEICDLIIAFYRKHLKNEKFLRRKDPISMEKIMRPVKLGTTIGKAVQSAREESAKLYEDEIEPAESAGLGNIVDPNGEKARQFISGKLRMEILGIKKYIPESDKSMFYELSVKKDGEVMKVNFENATQLHSQAAFNVRVFEAINDTPRSLEKDIWGKVRKALGKIMENVQVVPSATTIQGKMRVWIEQYLENKPTLSPIQAYRSGQPFVDDGCWHVFVKPFTDWAWQNKGMIEGTSRSQINLKRAGGEEKRFNEALPENPKKRVCFRAWRIPKDIATPPPILVVDNTRKIEEPDHAEKNLDSLKKLS